MEKQVVFLLVGGDESQKKELTDILMTDYQLANIYDMYDPIKQLLNNIFDLNYDILSDEKKNKKDFKKSIKVTPQQIGQILGYIRHNLPPNHPFNPHTIGLQRIKLGLLNNCKHAILELDNKVINRIVPDFSISCVYNDFAGEPGFYLVTNIKKSSEIKMARQYFNNVFVLGFPVELDKISKMYSSEIESEKIKPDYLLKGKKVKEKIDEIMKDIKTKVKVGKLKMAEVSKNKNSDIQEKVNSIPNAKSSGEEGRFVYEPKGQQQHDIKWLENLSTK